MLTKIRLTNFKCFRNLELNCAPIILLCGLNGMGKSSVIQALLLLRQSYVSGDLTEGRLVLGGEYVDLGTGVDILCEDAESDKVGFELQSDSVSEPWSVSFEYKDTADELTVDRSVHVPTTPIVPETWSESPPLAGRLLYIDAERTGPRKLYPLSDALARRGNFGSSSEYAFSFLNAHQDDQFPSDDPRCINLESRRMIDLVNRWLREITPDVNLQFEKVSNADALIAGFSFDRPGDVATRRYRATNVGFGLTYTIPVLLALLSKAGTLCLIENPEAHLHPRGQTKLGELAVRASIAGVQVVVETHSDHFMDGVRIAVRDEILEPSAVAIHYFERVKGRTAISSPNIDSDGRLSIWPSGFFDQHEENLARLLSPRS